MTENLLRGAADATAAEATRARLAQRSPGERRDIRETAVQETQEEAGVVLDPAALHLALSIRQGNPDTTHPHRVPPGQWDGEPAKCSEPLWADPGNLPAATVDYTAAAIRAIQQGAALPSTDGESP